MGLIFSNIPELDGTNTEIVLSNLSAVENELSNIFERRMAHLCELAHAIVNDGGDIDIIKSIIVSIRSDGDASSEEICSENEAEINTLFSKISLIERVAIFKEVFERIPLEKYHFYEGAEYISPDAKGRIAYIQNSYNDAAFEHFSSVLLDVKASYYETVSDVCDSVATDKCQYCILPLETTKDGKLISFYDIMIKNGFKINAAYELADPSQSGCTRYALLSKADVLVSNYSGYKNSSKHLEILYSDTDNVSLGELFMAAEYFGLKVEAVDTFSVKSLGEKKHVCIDFSANDADEKMFMTYLSVDCPDHILLGSYCRN